MKRLQFIWKQEGHRRTAQRYLCFSALFMTFVGTSLTLAQDIKPLVQSEDTHYFDFWVGTWYVEENGKIDTAGTRFVVRRSVHPAAYVEEWRMDLNSNSTLTATALRGWDKTNNRWMYTWVSANGLYQVWEGRKDQGHWYIYNRINIEGDQYLSRQGWIPESPGRVLRISEKSYDDGATWQLRFKQILVRKEP